MVESTKPNPYILLGEYASPLGKPKAAEKDILIIAAAQPLDALYPDWVRRSQLNKTEYQPFDVVSF